MTTAAPPDSGVLKLGGTKTYLSRDATWFPVGPREGLLVIRLELRKGRVRHDADLYQVIELDPPAGVIARAFGLLNRLDPAQELPYRVLIGRESSCSCKAGRCRSESDKHVDAIQAAIAKGLI
jgi:hypothetical protein